MSAPPEDIPPKLRAAAARGLTSVVEAQLGHIEMRPPEVSTSLAMGALDVAVAGRRWDTVAYLAGYLQALLSIRETDSREAARDGKAPTVAGPPRDGRRGRPDNVAPDCGGSIADYVVPV